MKQDQSMGCGTIIVIIFVFGMILSMLSNKKFDDKPVYTQQEQKGLEYAKTRFKQEGYSDKEAEEAAEVILRFNQAQQKK